MFGFLVGWGVFWFFIWITLLIISHGSRDEGINSLSIVMLFILVFYFIALFVGRAVS